MSARYLAAFTARHGAAALVDTAKLATSLTEEDNMDPLLTAIDEAFAPLARKHNDRVTALAADLIAQATELAAIAAGSEGVYVVRVGRRVGYGHDLASAVLSLALRGMA
jgi:hypothetical protein